MQTFETAIANIIKKDPRYPFDAYQFLREAFEFTIKHLQLQPNTVYAHTIHIPGQKLLEGIREFALLQYGPMTLTVFNQWNISTGEDFGNMVFNLVQNGILSKTDNDSINDFKNSYDFYNAFQKPFLPQNFPEAT